MNDIIIKILLREAKKAYKKGEVPVGALIEKNGKIISCAHNNRQKKHDVCGHAEINVIKSASKRLRDWRLTGCSLYVTLEPCDMCREIIKESRIENVFYLKSKDKNNTKKLVNYKQTNESEEYNELFTKFFKKIR